MVSEFEIWRAATFLIGRYGESASDHAEQRAKALEAQADLDGWARWRQIAAVLELQDQSKGG